MNATVQLGDTFSDAHEAETWKDENKDLSNLTHPFSGSERNRLFLSRAGKGFLDVSGLSGVDSPADGRVSVWFDYDRDGRQDLAVINSSSPLLQMYHNEIAPPEANKPRHGFVTLRFVGGNRSAKQSTEFSNRNGFGTKVTATIGDRILFREHLPSQGFAGQNSQVMTIGIGSAETVNEIKVAWPSGRTQSVQDLAAGTSLVVYENPGNQPEESSPAGAEGFVLESRPTTPQVVSTPKQIGKSVDTAALLTAAGSDRLDSKLVVLTTFASWCTSCARHQPGINELRRSFAADEVEVVGFTGDPDDPPDALREFLTRHDASYAAIVDPDENLRSEIDELLNDTPASNALPASLIVARDGQVLAIESGFPSASRLRQLLNATR